jgi:hypothetical protein
MSIIKNGTKVKLACGKDEVMPKGGISETPLIELRWDIGDFR